MNYPTHVKVLLINALSDHKITMKTYEAHGKYYTYVILSIDKIIFRTSKNDQKDAGELVENIGTEENIQKKICEFRGY